MFSRQNSSNRGLLAKSFQQSKINALNSDSNEQHKTVGKIKYHEDEINFLQWSHEQYRGKQSTTLNLYPINIQKIFMQSQQDDLEKTFSTKSLSSRKQLLKQFSPNKQIQRSSQTNDQEKQFQKTQFCENSYYYSSSLKQENFDTAHSGNDVQEETPCFQYTDQLRPEILEVHSKQKSTIEKIDLSTSKSLCDQIQCSRQLSIPHNSIENQGYRYFITDLLQIIEESKDTLLLKWLQECMQFLKLEGKHGFQLQSMLRVQSISHNNGVNRKTLVFGLDRTLIYCQEGKRFPGDQQIQVKLPNGKITKAFIKLRPNCYKTLVQLSRLAEIIVFSGSHKSYVEQVVKQIDHQQVISQVLSREHCNYLINGQIAKSLLIFGKSFRDIILIDSNFSSFNLQINNCIPILPYFGQEDDDQMKKLQQFLIDNVLYQPNVQYIISNHFKIQSWTQYQNIQETVQETYASN